MMLSQDFLTSSYVIYFFLIYNTVILIIVLDYFTPSLRIRNIKWILAYFRRYSSKNVKPQYTNVTNSKKDEVVLKNLKDLKCLQMIQQIIYSWRKRIVFRISFCEQNLLSAPGFKNNYWIHLNACLVNQKYRINKSCLVVLSTFDIFPMEFLGCPINFDSATSHFYLKFAFVKSDLRTPFPFLRSIFEASST